MGTGESELGGVAGADTGLVAFVGSELIARGDPAEVVLAAKRLQEGQRACTERVAVYDERTGGAVDIDYSGDGTEVVARLRAQLGLPASDASEPERRGPGRPRLGVVSREVSLLPRHWAWLSSQRGGASAALRRLVESARKEHAEADRRREVIEATHRFMWDIAGDAPGFEEASRALFAGDFDAFQQRIVDFPYGVQAQLLRFVARAR